MGIFERASANWPTTRATPDGGVEISGKYKSVDCTMFLGISWLALWGFCFWTGYNVGIGPALVLFMVGFIVLMLLEWVFPAKLAIKVYHDRIELPGFMGWRSYSRAVPLEFRVEQHHMAADEQARARRYGDKVKLKYREAIEAVMQYSEKRISLADMRERDFEKARALVMRLQNVCDSVDLAFDDVMGVTPAPMTDAGDFGSAPDIR